MQNSLYLLVCSVFSILIFLYGFFPVKNCDGLIASKHDLPSSIEDVELNISNLYPQVIDRLVIMVIDAMRLDFIDGIDGVSNMPYTSSVIDNQKACKVTGKADAPTVTMPRIKALTSGTVPNFIDVLLNFGSSAILEDNIITQGANQNWKMIFFGDNTWLKLFPDKFIRSDGTTSFFVADFTEVDDNVTRHLDAELDAADWKIMALHYLGLDHIGHFEGPKSSHIRPKLQEMDSIIKKIHSKLVKTDEMLSISSLLIVCGDHGMKDTGSHGGATLAEVLVPIIMIGQVCSNNGFSHLIVDKDAMVPQIDLAPTLSVLLGLPIPSSNLGKMIPQLLGTLPEAQQLYALYYNAKQVAQQYSSNNIQDSHLQTYQEAVSLHADWLRSGMPKELFVRAAAMYMKALEGMSLELTEALITFDLYAMTWSIVLLWQICYVLTICISRKKSRMQSTLKLILINSVSTICILLLNISFCAFSQCKSILCQNTVPSFIVMLLISFVFISNIQTVLNSEKPTLQSVIALCSSSDRSSVFLVLGSVMQIVSLGSSSFIEEEHQVWYFLWISLTFVLLYDLVNAGKAEQAWQWFFLLGLHRLFRKWNQTGDKWAALPDIGGWLTQSEQKYELSCVLLLGVAGLYFCCEFISSQCQSIPQSTRFRYRILWALAAFYIYCYRGATGIVFMPFNYPQSRGIVEVHIFWCILAILLFLGTVIPIYQLKVSLDRRSSLETLREIVGCVVIVWMFFCAVLHRPHDVVLIPAQVLVSSVALRVFQQRYVTTTCVFMWLGSVFYYYQGNSNSLASVDVAAGYVGQEDYNAVRVGLLLVANTYSAHVLAQLLVVALLSSQATQLVTCLNDSTRTVVMMRVVPVATYLVLVTFQRYHLFVWTVFSPKLLYESMHSTVVLAVVIITRALVYIVGSDKEKK